MKDKSVMSSRLEHSQMYCPSVVDLQGPDTVVKTKKNRVSATKRASPLRNSLNRSSPDIIDIKVNKTKALPSILNKSSETKIAIENLDQINKQGYP